MEAEFEQMRSRVLEAANEDLTGVYETWWQANSDFPELSVGERLVLAERAVRACLEEGLIAIEAGSYEQSRVVSLQDAVGLLQQWDTWAIPDGPNVFFGATEQGKATYSDP